MEKETERQTTQTVQRKHVAPRTAPAAKRKCNSHSNWCNHNSNSSSNNTSRSDADSAVARPLVSSS